MATYAIGDVQGCFGTLLALLDRLRFDTRRDRICLVGDLVNRGPRSLDVLRWARAAGPAVIAVLGNHDLHLLGRASAATDPRGDDTLDEVLGAPDRDDLLEWLRHQPFIHTEGSVLVVHAGLHPAWSQEEAISLARRAEAELRGPEPAAFLLAVRRSAAKDPEAVGSPSFAAKVFTRIRTCDSRGAPDFAYHGPPERAPQGLVPWYEVMGRRGTGRTVVFGHWAALGFRRGPGFIALDSGCAWGGALTAVRLGDEEDAVFREPCRDS